MQYIKDLIDQLLATYSRQVSYLERHHHMIAIFDSLVTKHQAEILGSIYPLSIEEAQELVRVYHMLKRFYEIVDTKNLT